MTLPPAAAALAAALKHGNIGCDAHPKGAYHLTTDHAEDADFLIGRLAASGWQVTREGEGLRAALEHWAIPALLVFAEDGNSGAAEAVKRCRAALASEHSGKGRVTGPNDQRLKTTRERNEARAALASGEEGPHE